MKKPLILLVDDDSTVLESLESSLAPPFSEIARIEAYTDPGEVLAALPEWAEEKRSIAVAIVDQKMPGMTGVELLRALRAISVGFNRAVTNGGADDEQFPPAAHIQSVLLTAYAGLDSALAAKNEAGVERYLEKPWSPKALIDTVGLMLGRYLDESGAGRHFVFREVTTPEELSELFRLRYAVFRQSGLGEFCHAVDDLMDIDAYDARAHHFGLYLREAGGGRVVGNLRLVRDEPCPSRGAISELASESPELRDHFVEPLAEPFPLMTYFPDAEVVGRLHREILARGEVLAEPGRLALLSEARFRGVARHLIASIVAYYYYCRSWDHAVLVCDIHHRRFYRPFGFHKLDGTNAHFLEVYNGRACCLVGSRITVPSPANEECRSLAARIKQERNACFCQTYPACQPGPYCSGDFSGTDLFCPLLSDKVLDRNG